MIKKLRRKIFWLLTAVLSVILLSALFIINLSGIRSDRTQTKGIIQKLTQADFYSSEHKNKFKNNSAVLSSGFYVIIADESGNIDYSTLISNNIDMADEQLKEYVLGALGDNKKLMRTGHISYSCVRQSDREFKIVLLDTALTDEKRVKLFLTSICVGMGGIILIAVFSAILSKRLVRPVSETFEGQKNFISDVSHEIKTPLAVINANAEMLERDIGENKWLRYIIIENERMNSLVNSLLMLSRADSNIRNVLYEEFDLSAEVTKTAMIFESLAFENQVDIETDIGSDISFYGNIDQIGQLINILTDNAIEHCTKSGTVKLSLRRIKKKTVLCVSNSGEPIPPEEQSKIFERFYRLDRSRNRDSGHYGLGLAIAKAIVTAHKGTIGVKCENNVTAFTVIFQSLK